MLIEVIKVEKCRNRILYSLYWLLIGLWIGLTCVLSHLLRFHWELHYHIISALVVQVLIKSTCNHGFSLFDLMWLPRKWICRKNWTLVLTSSSLMCNLVVRLILVAMAILSCVIWIHPLIKRHFNTIKNVAFIQALILYLTLSYQLEHYYYNSLYWSV